MFPPLTFVYTSFNFHRQVFVKPISSLNVSRDVLDMGRCTTSFEGLLHRGTGPLSVPYDCIISDTLQDVPFFFLPNSTNQFSPCS